ARGHVQFVINIPENFSRDLLRGDRPALLVEADATDPAATGIALGSLPPLLYVALQNDLKGPLGSLSATSGPIELRVHAPYNPEVVTQYNIVPGLMGVIDHDDGDDHRPRHHSRAGARYDGKPSLDAHAAKRSPHLERSCLIFLSATSRSW